MLWGQLCSPQTQLCCSNVCDRQPGVAGAAASATCGRANPRPGHVCAVAPHTSRGASVGAGCKAQQNRADGVAVLTWRPLSSRVCVRPRSHELPAARPPSAPPSASDVAPCESARQPGPRHPREARSCHPPRRATRASQQGPCLLPHSGRAQVRPHVLLPSALGESGPLPPPAPLPEGLAARDGETASENTRQAWQGGGPSVVRKL